MPSTLGVVASGSRRSVAVTGASSDVQTVIGGDLYRVVTWTSSGTIVPESSVDVEYLVVAGGGGTAQNGSGGGGGGGLRTNVGGTPLTVSGPTNAVVGAGGVVGVAVGSGGNGGPSSFGSVTTVGGGGGGRLNVNNAQGGGSGGGAPPGDSSFNGGQGTAGQGFRGGNATWISGAPTTRTAGGGGGGAGAQGGDTTSIDRLGNGGDGLAVDITGVSVFYAGGGGNEQLGSLGGLGGGGNRNQNGVDGLGGGGAGSNRTGGNGVVIVRWKL